MGFDARGEYTHARSIWINHSASIPAWYKR